MTSFLARVRVADLDRDLYLLREGLRHESPVAHIPTVNNWFVTRFDDVQFVAEHLELFPAEHGESPVEVTFSRLSLITVNGPVRHDLRRSREPNFAPGSRRRPLAVRRRSGCAVDLQPS